MSVTIDNTTFTHSHYDPDGDVLYLKTVVPDNAVEFDSTPEGHAVRFNAAGELVGITIVNARWLLDRDGKIEITLPHHVAVEAAAFDDALLAA